jgi:hypothetical protein
MLVFIAIDRNRREEAREVLRKRRSRGLHLPLELRPELPKKLVSV